MNCHTLEILIHNFDYENSQTDILGNYHDS